MANETGTEQRSLLIAGNWKMHGTLNSLEHFALRLAERVHEPTAQVLVCPAAVHLAAAVRSFRGQKVAIGAQDLHEEALGAHTGCVSGEMIYDLGVRWVLVGHSERRAAQGESDAVVARKVLAALRAGLHPVLCVGENRQERESGAAQERVAGQVQAVLDVLGTVAFSELTIAYEPVWAIGTGLTATPEQAQEVHAAIRGQLAAADSVLGAQLRILYGGSVKPDNAAALFGCPDIDGALIGGASLEADSFADIIAAGEAAAVS